MFIDIKLSSCPWVQRLLRLRSWLVILSELLPSGPVNAIVLHRISCLFKGVQDQFKGVQDQVKGVQDQANAMQTSIDHTNEQVNAIQTAIKQSQEQTQEQVNAMQAAITQTQEQAQAQAKAMQTAITQTQDQVAQILSLLQASSATPRQDAQLARTCRICRTPIAVGPSSPGRVVISMPHYIY